MYNHAKTESILINIVKYRFLAIDTHDNFEVYYHNANIDLKVQLLSRRPCTIGGNAKYTESIKKS